MAQLLNRVQPGDVITADMWNLAVDAINQLLEGTQTTGIKIAAMVPVGTADEPIRIGTLLQITGQNFGFTLGQASVSFEGQFGSITVSQNKLLVGSSDTRLVLIMPVIPGITQAGMTVTLRVSNGVASDVRSVFVMPIVVSLQGDIFVNWRADVDPNPQPNPISANQQADFAFQLQTDLNLPATFELSADIPDATATIPPTLINSIQFVDALNNTVLSSKRVNLGKNETRNIIVRIPQIPSTWANQTFSLNISATSGDITNSDMRSFTVGTVVTPSDPTITVLQTGWVDFHATTGEDDPDHINGNLTGTNIQLRAGWKLIVILNIQFGVTGTYDISIQPKTAGTLNGWTLDLVSTLPVVPANAGDSTVAQFGVTPSAGAVARGGIVFSVKRQGATSDQSKEYSVQLMP